MNSRDLDQQQIVNGIKTLNSEVIDQFVDVYSGPLFSVIFNYTKNPYDTEEILQDTFLRIIKKIETFREESDIWFWMKRIAINYGIMWLREHRSRIEKTMWLEDMMPTFTKSGHFVHPVPDWSVDPEEMYSNAELLGRLYDAIQSLPFEYRVPLILKDIEGYSTKEIAATLGLKQPTTATRIHRARLAVREKLARYFEGG